MRFLCVVIGYFCGCFLTADVVARLRTGKSAFLIGSGNPGMANIAGQLGLKWAGVTLLGDVIKTALPCLVFRSVFPELGQAAVLYAGVGVALGHGFPFWHWFRGGRSVAVSCAYIILFSPLFGGAAALAGFFTVLLTGYLAVGALLIPVAFLIPVFLIFGIEPGLVALAGTALLFILHRDSISRLVHKKEKKVDLFAKFKKA